jgi:predicted Zn-dependent peptidase
MHHFLDRSTPPALQPFSDVRLVRPKTYQLPNGANVLAVQAGTQPVVSLHLVFNAGHAQAPSRQIAHFAWKMLTEGTHRRSAADLMAALDRIGAFIDVGTGADFAHIELYCVSRHLPQAARLICEMLQEAAIPENELAKQKNIFRQQLRVNNEKTGYVATNTFRAMLFGENHPYGSHITDEQVQAINRDEVHHFYDSAIRRNPFTIVAAGAIDEAAIQVMANTFGQISFAPPMLGTATVGALSAADSVRRIEWPTALQTSLRIGKLIDIRMTDPDYIALTMLNEILGGYFGSRLMKNIREEKGLTYGIYSGLAHPLHACYFTIGADVRKELLEQAREEIFKEVHLLTNELVGEDELDLVKNYMQGTFIASLNTPFAIAEKHKAIYCHQLPEDFYDRMVSQLAAVSAEQLQ